MLLHLNHIVLIFICMHIIMKYSLQAWSACPSNHRHAHCEAITVTMATRTGLIRSTPNFQSRLC